MDDLASKIGDFECVSREGKGGNLWTESLYALLIRSKLAKHCRASQISATLAPVACQGLHLSVRRDTVSVPHN